jgi:hypothetical protein
MGSWTQAPARMTRVPMTRTLLAVSLAVAFALTAALTATVAAAADAPASSASPPAPSPGATPSETPTPPPAAAPSDAAPPAASPPAASPPAASPPATELDGPAPRAQQGAGGSTQSGIAGCAVWTDRCVICQRDSGVVACSNIGIACQPQPLMCLRQEGAPEKKQEN